MSDWDMVLRGGRVIDPETGLDAARDVAVAKGRIAAVGADLPAARAEVEVAGQVVTAGFIDLHSHVSDLAGQRLRALHGVRTALELGAGATPAARAYRRAADDGRPVNYGFAASCAMARMAAVAGARRSPVTTDRPLAVPAFERAKPRKETLPMLVVCVF